jgi:hypothetical protein
MTTSQLEVIAPVNEPVIITHRFMKALTLEMKVGCERLEEFLRKLAA